MTHLLVPGVIGLPNPDAQPTGRSTGRAEQDGRSLLTLPYPVILMSAPLGLSTTRPNNRTMKLLSPADRAINFVAADAQFHSLFHTLSQLALVYLLPTTFGLQDQTYVSNLGIIPPHVPSMCILSRFSSPPRHAEPAAAMDFMSMLDFDVRVCPYPFEGEAELKHLIGNIYVGGYGMRSSYRGLRWLAESAGAAIIPWQTSDPYLYHLDCSVLPLNRNYVLAFDDPDNAPALDVMAQYIEVIRVRDRAVAHAGITNSIVIENTLICNNIIDSHDYGSPRYEAERRKLAILTDVCSRVGLNLIEIRLDEFRKSGADLSCLAMFLHRGNDVSAPVPGTQPMP